MRRKVTPLILCLLICACGSQPKEEDYPAKIAAIRAAKDESFRKDPDSPVPGERSGRRFVAARENCMSMIWVKLASDLL